MQPIPIWKSDQDSSTFFTRGKFEGLSAAENQEQRGSQNLFMATANQDACRNEGKGNGKIFKLIDSRGAIYTYSVNFFLICKPLPN